MCVHGLCAHTDLLPLLESPILPWQIHTHMDMDLSHTQMFLRCRKPPQSKGLCTGEAKERIRPPHLPSVLNRTSFAIPSWDGNWKHKPSKDNNNQLVPGKQLVQTHTGKEKPSNSPWKSTQNTINVSQVHQ